MESGKLIAIEGPSGVGKTTISQALAQRLEQISTKPVLLRTSPGALVGTLGHHIYGIHHRPADFGLRPPSPLALQMLHVAAHIDNIEAELRTALEAGHSVILDRCWWSTWVYGVLSGCSVELLEDLIRIERRIWPKAAQVVVLLTRSHLEGNPESITYEKVRVVDETSNFKVANDQDVTETVDRILSALLDRVFLDYS